jgi:hypothetical protein
MCLGRNRHHNIRPPFLVLQPAESLHTGNRYCEHACSYSNGKVYSVGTLSSPILIGVECEDSPIHDAKGDLLSHNFGEVLVLAKVDEGVAKPFLHHAVLRTTRPNLDTAGIECLLEGLQVGPFPRLVLVVVVVDGGRCRVVNRGERSCCGCCIFSPLCVG